jgi:hypothetical protein
MLDKLLEKAQENVPENFHHRLDSLLSYIIGVGVPTVIHFLPIATEFCQFVAAAFGAAIVVHRYLYDRELRRSKDQK